MIESERRHQLEVNEALRQENERLRAESERLQAKVGRLCARGIEDMRYEIQGLQREIERLRGLLKECVPYINATYPRLRRNQLIDRIGEEVGDERPE